MKQSRFLRDMLKDKRLYKTKEDEVFEEIEYFEKADRLEEASKLFLAYINLVADKLHKIALEKDRPLLDYIRKHKSDRFFEELKNDVSYVSRCNPKMGIQLDEIYF